MAAREWRFADVAVTPTAKEFDGIYRGKKQHENDFDAVLERASVAGVSKVMLTGMSLSDVDFILDIVRSRPQQCSMTIGVHPYNAAEPDKDPKYLANLSDRINQVLQETPRFLSAFGELGLDYDRLVHASTEVQIRTFKAQLELFVKEQWDLPLFLHCRAACQDFIEVLKPYVSLLPRGGLVHSFVGSKDEMLSLVDMGHHISVNGFSFQDPESLEMVRAIPLDSLQLETDAPWGYIPPNSELAKKYPAPVALPASKKRDKFERGLMVKERNESCAIGQVGSIVAGLKGLSIDEVVQAAWVNSNSMFRLAEDVGAR
ncbi:hypothetical protein PRZ48_005699 [Zasmidium cellare]|uniref:TatD related DNase n=1 Tax=Zasmidium cellare TaxID=395010 RepID=A0ABR0ELL3_ZASCE|nr:hypothetical protein PRZ48_005699 [Zasmidium cellare]